MVAQPSAALPGMNIVEPGQPERSVLFLRMGQRGLGSLQMPPVGTEFVDDAGLAAVRAWIATLPVR
jgi:hypothetical protein